MIFSFIPALYNVSQTYLIKSKVDKGKKNECLKQCISSVSYKPQQQAW